MQDIELSIRRCAVCRIDLKGRFVFVDDSTERLMGYTREELFGKPFMEFVDEPDKALIQSLIRQHNRVETNFDSVRIRLLNRSNEAIAARAIIALNFIAGNAVNYQIIIDTGRTAAYTVEEPVQRDRLQPLVAELLALDEPVAELAIDALYHFLSPDRAVIYRPLNNEPEPMFSSRSTNQSHIRILPVPTKLLRWVAESDEEYCFDDADQVRRAIERTGIAPSEFICKLHLGSEQYLVRVACEESPDPMQTQREVADIRLAVRLVERLYPAQLTTPPILTSTVLNDLKSALATATKIVTSLATGKSATT